MAVPHALTGLSAACEASLFVRTWNRVPSFDYGDIGHASAVAMAMLVMVALLTNFYFWVYRRAEKRLG